MDYMDTIVEKKEEVDELRDIRNNYLINPKDKSKGKSKSPPNCKSKRLQPSPVNSKSKSNLDSSIKKSIINKNEPPKSKFRWF